MEFIAQLVTICASIFGGFFWLITYLQKRFALFSTQLSKQLTEIKATLDSKVSQELCKERRMRLPCCTGDGTFRCPMPADPKLNNAIDTLNDILQDMKSKS